MYIFTQHKFYDLLALFYPNILILQQKNYKNSKRNTKYDI